MLNSQLDIEKSKIVMTLKDRIIKTLKDTGAQNMDKMLQYMEKHGFYECSCRSHNHWKGGTSQHIWAVYLIAKALRDKEKKNANVARYATDEKLAIVCLLHDLCDMKVIVYDEHQKEVDGHGKKSYYIMKNLGVGTEVERKVVCNHMHDNAPYHFNSQQETEEYIVLHGLITRADKQASGTAWNSTRFKEGRTQHKGTPAEPSYLRAVAMDRTVQSGKYKLYMDVKYELREYHNYNRNKIQWNSCQDAIANLQELERVQLDSSLDVISAAHQHMDKTGERLCLVVGINPEIPMDNDSRLRRGCIEEQDILICSNLLNSFYSSKHEHGHHFTFTMRDEIKAHYRDLPGQDGGIFMKDVTMIRDGKKRGFPFVEPWTVDILMVPSETSFMFAISSDNGYLK